MVINRDLVYCLVGIIFFVVSAVLLYFLTELSLLEIIIIAFLVSLASDILIIIDNDIRNRAPDAKFHHRNELVGENAVVVHDFAPAGNGYHGKIRVFGESWKACSTVPGLVTGDVVLIIDRNAMMFTVEKVTR